MVVQCPKKFIISPLLSRIARRRHQRWAITSTIILTLLFLMGYFPLNDHTRFECPSDVNKRLISQQQQLSVRGPNVFSLDYYFQITNSSKEIHDDSEKLLSKWECVDMSMNDLETRKLLKICIYDPSKDLQVSHNLKTRGSWETENVEEMAKALGMYPGLTLVDLGSNLGVFTLQAAVRGAQVVAVDALLPNHRLLHRSLVYNNLSCNVTLLHNAVHSHRRPMRIAVQPSNIGGSVVRGMSDPKEDNILPSRHIVDAICLDDLVPLVLGKDVFLKMDLEGSEVAALRSAHEFFAKANVKVLMMEWINYRYNERDSQSIKTFLASQNMVPTWGVNRDRTIDLEASDSWPDNVFWMKV